MHSIILYWRSLNSVFLLIFFSSSFRPLRLASLHSPVDPKVFLLLRTRNRIERLCFAHYSGYDVTSNRRRIVYRPVGQNKAFGRVGVPVCGKVSLLVVSRHKARDRSTTANRAEMAKLRFHRELGAQSPSGPKYTPFKSRPDFSCRLHLYCVSYKQSFPVRCALLITHDDDVVSK